MLNFRDSVPKLSISGPQRERAVEETWEAIKPFLPRIGVTRVADITGLDRIGIPVYNAIVPRSSDLISVYNGKGANEHSARTSAVMEAVERFSAWQPRSADIVASEEDLERENIPFISPSEINFDRYHMYHSKLPISWIFGFDLIASQQTAVPVYLAGYYQSFHEIPPFPIATTNGLASGNSLEEATCHAVCELVERDDWTMAEIISNRLSRAIKSGSLSQFIPNTVENWFMDRNCSVDLESLPNPHQLLIQKYRAAGVDVELKYLDSQSGIPTFLCVVSENLGPSFSQSHQGLGTHPNSEVAALRALSEAAQSRVVDIQAMREDISLPDEDVPKYMLHIKRSSAFNPQAWAYRRTDNTVDFSTLESFPSEDIICDLNLMIGALQRTGISKVVVVDLSPPWLPVSVVRVIIPGIESWAIDRGRIGERALNVWRKNIELLEKAIEIGNRRRLKL